MFLWVIFALVYTDPDCESGYGSRDPIEYGSNPDPDGTDPQHWFKVREQKEMRKIIFGVFYMERKIEASRLL